MFIQQYYTTVMQRDFSTHKLRIYIKITIVATQDSNICITIVNKCMYAINAFYENTIQFILVDNVISIWTISCNMENKPMDKLQDSIF